MRGSRISKPGGHTRRDAVRLFAATGAALTIGGNAANAQGTPAPATPTAAYAHPEALVDPEWLMTHQDDPATVVVGLMPNDAFEKGHIPGSLPIDWPQLEVVDTSDASIASWRTAVEEMIGDLGIDRGSTVVVYDNDTLFAARLWWVLHWLGHERVHILDGGLAAWREVGGDVEQGPVVRTMIKYPPYEGTPHEDRLAQMDEVLAAIGDDTTVLVDARTPDEYAKGHIPGAVNVNYPRNAAANPPNRYEPAERLLAMYREVGVTPDRSVIPYCSSGVRSAVTAFSLWLIGFERVALYTGSWQEWGANPDTPKTEGDQP